MLRLLIGLRVRLAWNYFARGERRPLRALMRLVAALIGAAFIGTIVVNTSALVVRLARLDPGIEASILPAILVAGSLLTLVTSLGTAFHHLFVGADEELLLAAPVRLRDLFVLKVLETWRDCLHIVLFDMAALAGVGLAVGMPPVYFFGAAGLAILLTLAGAMVGLLLTLALTRIRFGTSLMGVSRLAALLLFLPAGALGVPALGIARSRGFLGISQDNLQGAADTLRDIGPPPPWAPTTWATHVLLADEAALVSAALLVLGTLCCGVLGAAAFEGAFQASWEHVRFAGPRGRRARRWGWGRGGSSVPFAGPLLSILHKDARTLVRDPRWRTSLLIGLAALGLPLLVLSAGSDPSPRLSPEARFWIGLFPVPYLAYVAGSQHGAAALVYEGRNLALLRAAPIGFVRMLLAKLAGSLVVVLGITWLATLVLALRRSPTGAELVAALGMAAWLATGGTTAGLVGAALTADFETDNPQRRVGCFGTLITSGLSALFFVTNTGLLIWLLLRAIGVPRQWQSFAPLLDWLSLGLALLAVGLLVGAALLGVRRLTNWEAS